MTQTLRLEVGFGLRNGRNQPTHQRGLAGGGKTPELRTELENWLGKEGLSDSKLLPAPLFLKPFESQAAWIQDVFVI